jgi:hypothetical protein
MPRKKLALDNFRSARGWPKNFTMPVTILSRPYTKPAQMTPGRSEIELVNFFCNRN